MITPKELLNEKRSLDFLKGAKRIRVCIIMEEYAKRYHEQQVKSVDLADIINWVAVSEQTPPECEWVIAGHNEDKWVDRASYHGGTWENGECEIYPTHWAVVEPPCL